MDYALLGKRIKEYRVKRNLTQEVLSEKVEISSVFLSQIENNKRIPSLETVYKVAKALNISIDSLFDDELTPYQELEYLLTKFTEEEIQHIIKIIEVIFNKEQS